jgi:hypothetical protein
MIRLSWNEIRDRALKFSTEWANETNEDAEAKSFWDAFFEVFGIPRRTVARFEDPVHPIKGKYRYIDLLWPGVLLVEHKSKGKDLSKASSQAFSYIQDLISEGREEEIPQYVVISDFSRLIIYDLEKSVKTTKYQIYEDAIASEEMELKDLIKHVRSFAFMRGEKPITRDPEDPANIKAAEIMARLHDSLERGGFKGHDLERFLVRVLFCLFAEDSGIFEPNSFTSFIQNHTRPDGSDFGAQINRLFEVLNSSESERQSSLDEDLACFPYVNGDLFKERLAFADFNTKMREVLLVCAKFNWSRISPAVFGSLFQSIMDKNQRRGQGAHYTSEADILKVVRSLFLDELKAELDEIKLEKGAKRESRLESFHNKLCKLCFFDPACGCGNFLVITYRELRLLELDVLKLRYGFQTELSLEDVNRLSKVNVDQMFGIELSEWPARIAEVALWLMDHQMNLEVSSAFHQFYLRIPLRSSPQIISGNSLRLNWKDLLEVNRCTYVLGNPPFRGAKFLDPQQQEDMDLVAKDIDNYGLLDYVSAWYIKATEYIQGSRIKVGLVSTNSITQGEQAGVLWPYLFKRGVKIHFAHRTFSWQSEARGKAHVHVVIIGFGCFDVSRKYLFDYEADYLHPTMAIVPNISPYLTSGPDEAITNRSTPLCSVSEIVIGNKPIDGGNYLFTPTEKAEFIKKEPSSERYFRQWLGAEEFINNIERWFLWLGNCSPEEIRKMPEVAKKVQAVKDFRKESKSPPTRKLAETPTKFHVENIPNSKYLLIPRHSSIKRVYIPMGFIDPSILSGDANLIIKTNSLFHLGVMQSKIHMAWVKEICGRIKSDYRYSAKLVYNNFPWPIEPTKEQINEVEEATKNILAVRQSHSKATLADLYDPLTMPADLVKAHHKLDRTVEKCYRSDPFESDRNRFEYLFDLYLKLKNPLGLKTPPVKKANVKREKNKKPGIRSWDCD